MQEAKKACKSEALEGVDYSKVQLSLEDGMADGMIDGMADATSYESDEEVSMW